MSESKSADTRKYKAATKFRGTADLNEVLKTIPITSFPAPAGGIIIINSDATIAEAARVLSDNNILSAPVRDVSQPDDAPWSEKYIGLVDMTDIVLFLLDALEGKFDGRPGFMENLAGNPVMRTKVTEVLHVFKFGPFVPLDEDSTLLDAVLILGKHGLHRLCVVKLGSDIVNIITQSALVAALNAAMSRLEGISTKSLADLGLSDPVPVTTANLDDSVWVALKAMRDAHVSAVPVLGADGSIAGVFSNHDARQLVSGGYEQLFQSLRSFISARLAKEVDARLPAVTVKPTESLARTVAMLTGLHLHRLFIADDRNRPVGVVSLSDILSVVAHEPADYFGSYFEL